MSVIKCLIFWILMTIKGYFVPNTSNFACFLFKFFPVLESKIVKISRVLNGSTSNICCLHSLYNKMWLLVKGLIHNLRKKNHVTEKLPNVSHNTKFTMLCSVYFSFKYAISLFLLKEKIYWVIYRFVWTILLLKPHNFLKRFLLL